MIGRRFHRAIGYIGVLIPLVLSGCIGSKEYSGVVGFYSGKGNWQIYDEFTFSEDGTFTHNWQTGLIGGETTGLWERNKNGLLLNSDIQPCDPCYTIHPNSSDSLYIIIREFSVDSVWEGEAGLATILFIEGKDTVRQRTADTYGRLPLSELDPPELLVVSFLNNEARIPYEVLPNGGFDLVIHNWDKYRFITESRMKVARDSTLVWKQRTWRKRMKLEKYEPSPQPSPRGRGSR